MLKDEFELFKSVLTDETFESMKWHDCRIHSIAFFPDEYEIGFDIDYIFKWVDPGVNETNFKFWLAPASLIFHNVNELEMNLEPFSGLSIDRVEKSNEREPKNMKSLENKKLESQWRIECMEGEIKLYSLGYSLIVRKIPKLYSTQYLTMEERGGISFSRVEVQLPKD